MTHSGGKPHNVGDKGQRYEIRATGYPKEQQSVIGWMTDVDRAAQAAVSLLLAPGCTEVVVIDREAGNRELMKFTGIKNLETK